MALGRAGERVARWDDVVGARGLEPPVPTPRIALPEWIAKALRAVA
jgi:hypothetical protein